MSAGNPTRTVGDDLISRMESIALFGAHEILVDDAFITAEMDAAPSPTPQEMVDEILSAPKRGRLCDQPAAARCGTCGLVQQPDSYGCERCGEWVR